ncbi:uncharacterized protein LOC106645582 [Copidosoma floridanum]|uniref:uncharacterized protein LOC106645582 n=1 Tax=Copidosoma floridanum TaxID=29053 RepID=UPI0006C9503C|nr:uncharacterized protein LOC106645582 [Copidosoma floridanum]
MFSKVLIIVLIFVSLECVISFRIKLKALANKEKEDLKILVESLADLEYRFTSFCDLWKKSIHSGLEILFKYRNPYLQYPFIDEMHLLLESALKEETNINEEFRKMRVIFKDFDKKSDREQVNVQEEIKTLKVKIDASIASVFKIYPDLDSKVKAEITQKQKFSLMHN